MTISVPVQAKHMEDSPTSQFEATQRTIIDNCVIANTSAVSVNFAINIVERADYYADHNRVVPYTALAAGARLEFLLQGQNLMVGDALWTDCDVAGALVVRVNGRLVT